MEAVPFQRLTPERNSKGCGLRLQIMAVVCLLWALSIPRASAAEPKWIRVSSPHFAVLTNAGEKRGREIAARFEQMRSVFAQLLMKNRVNISVPLDIIAVKSDSDYEKLAPVSKGRLTADSAFFLPGPDRNYIVLDLADENSWRIVAHPLAHMLLNFNYPPTQGWFDEGFAEYFSSLQDSGKQMQIGGDPELTAPATQGVLPGPQRQSTPSSLVSLLSAPVWLSIPDLFTTRHDVPSYAEGNRHTMFYAESWMLTHYLITNDKLSETGTYLGLVEMQKQPVEQAIQQAYGMSAAQLEQAVKDYCKAVAPILEGENRELPAGVPAPIRQFPAPVNPNEMAATVKDVPESEAHALVAEMQARLPEHREAAVQELQAIIADPKSENAIAHRALGWVDMEKKDLKAAGDELGAAIRMDSQDIWSRYYLSLMKYQEAQGKGQYFQGLANLLQDMRLVVDWDPDFAEAYNMLAMARVEGGGVNSAKEAIRMAVSLSPRNQRYQLNMARIEMAGKDWDAATSLLQRLQASRDPQIAQAARQDLGALPTLKKYGIMPYEERESQEQQAPSAETRASAKNKEETSGGEEPAASAPPDTRKSKYLKGRLLRVDCSAPPVAVLIVVSTGRTMKLRTDNYKSLLLLGADQFSCTWRNVPVVINYKPGGKADGDLVSLEID